MKIKDIIKRGYIKFMNVFFSKKHKERQAIIEARKHFKNKKIVACEIGAFMGKHALDMLKNLNITKLYIIDPYARYEDYKKSGSYKHIVEAKKISHNLLKPYQDKIVWIEKFSDDAIKDIKEKIDFLYIDGNHYSPYIDNDLENYYPLVKEGGIISGHDYCNRFKDVVLAVDRFFKKKSKKAIFGHGNDWVVKR